MKLAILFLIIIGLAAASASRMLSLNEDVCALDERVEFGVRLFIKERPRLAKTNAYVNHLVDAALARLDNVDLQMADAFRTLVAELVAFEKNSLGTDENVIRLDVWGGSGGTPDKMFREMVANVVNQQSDGMMLAYHAFEMFHKLGRFEALYT